MEKKKIRCNYFITIILTLNTIHEAKQSKVKPLTQTITKSCLLCLLHFAHNFCCCCCCWRCHSEKFWGGTNIWSMEWEVLEKQRQTRPKNRVYGEKREEVSNATFVYGEKLYSFRVLSFVWLTQSYTTRHINWIEIEFINNSQPISFYCKVKSCLSIEFCASIRQKEQSQWFLFIYFRVAGSFLLFSLLTLSLSPSCLPFFLSIYLFLVPFIRLLLLFLNIDCILCTLRVCSKLSDFLVAASVFNRVFLLICFA